MSELLAVVAVLWFGPGIAMVIGFRHRLVPSTALIMLFFWPFVPFIVIVLSLVFGLADAAHDQARRARNALRLRREL